VRRFLITLALLASLVCASAGPVEDYAAKLAPLIDPAKLATLRARGANPRVQKAVYWLAKGRDNNAEPAKVLDAALRTVGVSNEAVAELTKAALLRNLTIAQRLGCLEAEGMVEMRKGKSPTILLGPCRGQELSVDHIIPRVVAPELDNVIANLELPRPGLRACCVLRCLGKVCYQNRQRRKPLIEEKFSDDLDCIRFSTEEWSCGVEIDDVKLLRNDGEEGLEAAPVQFHSDALLARSTNSFCKRALITLNRPDVFKSDSVLTESHQIVRWVGTREKQHV
jgi:hypothetical protein